MAVTSIKRKYLITNIALGSAVVGSDRLSTVVTARPADAAPPPSPSGLVMPVGMAPTDGTLTIPIDDEGAPAFFEVGAVYEFAFTRAAAE